MHRKGRDADKMKTILLHGLGQTPQDWEGVVRQLSTSHVACPPLFSPVESGVCYPQILEKLEAQYAHAHQLLCICGLSLGAMLALDFTMRHRETVAELVLISPQYKSPTPLIDLQNLLFRSMPARCFDGIGLPKEDVIALAHSMRSLDFTPQLHTITCPVTILCGANDLANVGAAKRLSKRLARATLHIVPGAGHELNRCAPEVIAATLNSTP